MVIASEWGPWLYISTASSDQCKIEIVAPNGTILTSGVADIDITGAVASVITIPIGANVGNYTARAVIPDQASISTTFTIIAANIPLTPIIFGHDWQGQPINAVSVDSLSQKFYGLNWAPFNIDIYLDSASGVRLGTAWGSPPHGAFAIDLTFPDGGRRKETHKIVAVQQNTRYTANCTIYYEGPPR
jgi:hypothetical protein